MASERITVYEPLSAPIRGLNSRAHLAQIPPGSGFFHQMQNVRWADDGVLRVRSGCSQVSNLIQSGVQPKGAGSFTFNGQLGTLFAAVQNATFGITYVHKSADAATWQEITGGPGKYAATRMVANAGGNAYDAALAIVHDKYSGRDVLTVQNGHNFPIVYDGQECVTHEPIVAPSAAGARTRVTVGSYAPIADDSTWTPTTVAGSALVVSTDQAAPDAACKIAVGSGVTTGDLGYISFVATLDSWDQARQIHVVVDGGDDAEAIDTLVSSIRIKVSPPVIAWSTLYDPGSATYQKPLQTALAGSSAVMLSFSAPTTALPSAISRIGFEWVASSPASSAFELLILGAMASNVGADDAVRGSHEHAISYYNPGSRAESPEYALPVEYELIEKLGCRRSPAVQLPPDASLFYTSEVYFRNPSQAQLDKGVSEVRIYRREVGEEDYSFSRSFTAGSYSMAGWTFTSSVANGVVSVKDQGPENRLYWLSSPGAFHATIPIGRCMVAANGRLIVGARPAGGGDTFPRICLSRRGHPFRFSEVSDLDDLDTAAEESLPGEGVEALVAASGSLVGSSTVYAFTDSSVYVIATHVPGSPLMLTRVASSGTSSPHTVVEREGRIYFVDNEMRVRRLAEGGSTMISLPVDDKLQAIASSARRNPRGAWFNDRYYLAYPSGGDQNNRLLVWSERAQAWESDDLLPLDTLGRQLYADILFRWVPPAVVVGQSSAYGAAQAPRLMFMGSAGAPFSGCICYRHESGGQAEFGHPIAVTLSSGELHQGLWQGLTVRRVGFLADSQPHSLDVLATYKPRGSSSATCTMAGLFPCKWAWSGLMSPTADFARGVAASVTVSSGLNGGKAVYGMVLEAEPRETMAAENAP